MKNRDFVLRHAELYLIINQVKSENGIGGQMTIRRTKPKPKKLSKALQFRPSLSETTQAEITLSAAGRRQYGRPITLPKLKFMGDK